MAQPREDTGPAASGTVPRRLDSWKEIAAYLRRDVTTVRRWEKREHLPIRRHRHGTLGSVYAFTEEIDAWREQRSNPRPSSTAHPDTQQPTPDGRAGGECLVEGHAALAVLPFANLTPIAGTDYFSDGLAEDIINALGRVPHLRVIARTSSFAFKGKHEDVRAIAAALGVTHVLEGSVQRDGTRMRVRAQLIRAADGTHVWSERYDREVLDVFVVQDEIASAIVAALEVEVTSQLPLPRSHTPKLDAYEAWLKGRYRLPSRSMIDAPEASTRAEQHFHEAAALDPRWAAPHTALARLYLYLGRLGIRDLADMMARARSEALASLDIDPGEATAHAVLGAIAASYEYDWDKAGARFQSAMASTVVEPAVDDLFALCYLVPLGRFETAKRHIEQAIARDPLNLLWRERRLTILASSGRYEEAIGEARKVLEFNSNSFLAHFTIAGSYLTLGNLRDARSTAEEAYRLAPWHPAAAGLFAGLLERAGDHERAAPLVASIEKANRPIAMLNYYVASGHVDAAVDCFVEALEQRELIASQLVRADFLKPLHSSPRWAVVLKTMNLDADRQPLMP